VPAPSEPPQPEPGGTPGEPAGPPEGAPIAPPQPTAPTPPPPPAPPPPPPAPGPAEGDGRFAAPISSGDTMASPGYLPGYRSYQGFSLSPYAPRVGALPGGVTPGSGAPMPLQQWTFRFNGFLSASLQGSLNRRRTTVADQGGPVFHTPPQTLDEYASFLGTSTMPGQWVDLRFSYGNPIVSANISLNTWNPSDAATYYQIGSQYFINNAFLAFDVPRIGNLKLRSTLGYFYSYYGNLSQYGTGMYTNSIIGSPRGVGEIVSAVYTLSPTVSLLFEHGILGNRASKVPDGVVPSAGNGSANPIFSASFVHHVHVGIQRSGASTIRAQLHYLTNWAADDRTQVATDNPVTRQINEAYIRDGHVNVYGADTTVQHQTWGFLGVAASVTSGSNAFPVRGLFTFGGEGQTLTDRWWGGATGGTGKLYTAGFNYSASLGRILAGSRPFSGENPDLILNTGFVIARTTTNAQVLGGTTVGGSLPPDVALFNQRTRYKFGADVLYTALPWLSGGLRVDRVAPNSKDSGETFYVVAPRLIFKRSRNSREAITLLYGKWFYGPRSHNEASSLVPSDIGLDDQLIALNVNLWW
jgi:hypothetical protein